MSYPQTPATDRPRTLAAEYATWETGALMAELARLNRRMNQSLPEAVIRETARQLAALSAEIATR